MNLTIAYITSRREPNSHWFFDSLRNQISDFVPTVIVVDSGFSKDRFPHGGGYINEVFNFLPKPTIWQGKHRITKEDWWAKSNALNTAIILCETEWIAFVDDRSVLCDCWLQCVREAILGGYAVCGSYEKRSNMKVENGVITDMGEFLGEDERPQSDHPVSQIEWNGKSIQVDWYGGSGALPLDWCLKVNGFSEDLCDGLGSEDAMFGKTLRCAGYPIRYDSRMRIIEDRTPSEIDGALKRADKNSDKGFEAKSWQIVKAFWHQEVSGNSYDIRQHRVRVQAGEDLQNIMPSASHYDWYDGQFIGDME